MFPGRQNMHIFIPSGMHRIIQEQPHWVMTTVPDPLSDNGLNIREEIPDYFMWTDMYTYKTIHILLYMHHCKKRIFLISMHSFSEHKLCSVDLSLHSQMAPIEKKWFPSSSHCLNCKETRPMWFIHQRPRVLSVQSCLLFGNFLTSFFSSTKLFPWKETLLFPCMILQKEHQLQSTLSFQ